MEEENLEMAIALEKRRARAVLCAGAALLLLFALEIVCLLSGAFLWLLATFGLFLVTLLVFYWAYRAMQQAHKKTMVAFEERLEQLRMGQIRRFLHYLQ